MAHTDLFEETRQRHKPAIVNADWLGRACRKCGNQTFLTTEPKGPHREGLRCCVCGHHNGWLPVVLSDELRATAGKDAA
jgi:hypothetical protein